MIVTEIRYERLFNITTYTHETIGLTCQLDAPVAVNDTETLYRVLIAAEQLVTEHHNRRQAERLQEGENVLDTQDKLFRVQNDLFDAKRELEDTTARLAIAKDMLDSFRNFCELNGMEEAYNIIAKATDQIPF